MEVGSDDVDVFEVIRLEPNVDSLGGKTAIKRQVEGTRDSTIAHEISGGKLRHKFVRHWFALWHDPASSVRGNHPTMR